MKGDFSQDTFDPTKHFSSVRMQQGRVQVDADWNQEMDIFDHRVETETLDFIGSSGAPDNNAGFEIQVAALSLAALTPGTQGNSYQIAITYYESNDPGATAAAAKYNLSVADLFQLVVTNTQSSSAPETYSYVTVKGSSNRIDLALKVSQLIQVLASSTLPALQVPPEITQNLGDGTPTTPASLIVSLNYLTIGAGRYYVNGMLCENEQIINSFLLQPDYPVDITAVNALPIIVPNGPDDGYYLVFMDAWKMGVTAVDDPSLLEVALNGADTTGRLRNLSQVKLMPIEVNGISPASISADIVFAPNGPQSAKNNYQRWATLATQTASDPSQGQLTPQVNAPANLQNQLYRVEVHVGGTAQTATFKWSRDNGSIAVRILSISGQTIALANSNVGQPLPFSVGQWVELSTDDSELLLQPGVFVQINSVDTVNNLLTINWPSNITFNNTITNSLSNFNNGIVRRWDSAISILANFSLPQDLTITALTNTLVYIDPGIPNETPPMPPAVPGLGVTLGPGVSLPANVQVGQFVELTNLTLENNQQFGYFTQVLAINNSGNGYPLIVSAAGIDFTQLPNLTTLRLLNMGTTPVTGSSLALENGLAINFGTGSYQSGNYWLIPSRTITNNIEWPQDPNNPNAFLPLSPKGILHFYEKLSLVQKTSTGWNPIPIPSYDCRTLFSPIRHWRKLVAITADPSAPVGSVYINSNGQVEVGAYYDPHAKPPETPPGLQGMLEVKNPHSIPNISSIYATGQNVPSATIYAENVGSPRVSGAGPIYPCAIQVNCDNGYGIKVSNSTNCSTIDVANSDIGPAVTASSSSGVGVYAVSGESHVSSPINTNAIYAQNNSSGNVSADGTTNANATIYAQNAGAPSSDGSSIPYAIQARCDQGTAIFASNNSNSNSTISAQSNGIASAIFADNQGGGFALYAQNNSNQACVTVINNGDDGISISAQNTGDTYNPTVSALNLGSGYAISAQSNGGTSIYGYGSTSSPTISAVNDGSGYAISAQGNEGISINAFNAGSVTTVQATNNGTGTSISATNNTQAFLNAPTPSAAFAKGATIQALNNGTASVIYASSSGGTYSFPTICVFNNSSPNEGLPNNSSGAIYCQNDSNSAATISATNNGGGPAFYNGGGGYANLTAAQDILIDEAAASNMKPGLLVSVTGETKQRQDKNGNIHISTALTKVKLANTRNDKRLIGIFTHHSSPLSNHWYSLQQNEQMAVVNAVGNGRGWVSNINGEINAGDYITSSEIPGYGMRQDDDVLHNYTLGKAIEDVDWSSVTEAVSFNGVNYKVYLIGVVYTSG